MIVKGDDLSLALQQRRLGEDLIVRGEVERERFDLFRYYEKIYHDNVIRAWIFPHEWDDPN